MHTYVSYDTTKDHITYTIHILSGVYSHRGMWFDQLPVSIQRNLLDPIILKPSAHSNIISAPQ